MYRLGTVLFMAATLSAAAVPGIRDTIGGTTYDFSIICAGIQRMAYFDPDWGMHAAWCYSADTGMTFPDRGVRYNFWHKDSSHWNWIDPDYVRSGAPVFTERVGYGSIDLDPVRGVAVISAWSGSPVAPVVARDVAPGAGIFEFCSGRPVLEGQLWDHCAVSSSGTIHLAMIDDASRDGLFHSRCSVWPDWSVPFDIPGSEPDPCFPNQHVTASKQSGRVAVVWEYSEGQPDPGFYRMSTDDGQTWQDVVDLGWPPAFGGDTMTSYHIASFGSLFDRVDSLHIVAAVMPFVSGHGLLTPSAIWHWCPANDPVWHEIRRAGPESLSCPIGYNTLFACRPKIAQDPSNGRLCASWSEYDAANSEPRTQLLRADIWASTSTDNGVTWTLAVRLTGPDSASRVHFDLAPIVNDTMHIVYLEDLVAGAFVQQQGPPSFNPIVYLRVPVARLGLKERPTPCAAPRSPEATIVRGVLRIADSRQDTEYRAELLDIAGRKVMDLRPGRNDIRHLSPGVYFVVREGPRNQGSGSSSRKVVVCR